MWLMPNFTTRGFFFSASLPSSRAVASASRRSFFAALSSGLQTRAREGGDQADAFTSSGWSVWDAVWLLLQLLLGALLIPGGVLS